MKKHHLKAIIICFLCLQYMHLVFASGVNFNDAANQVVMQSSGQSFSNAVLTGNIGIATTSSQTSLAIIGNVGVGTWTAAGGNLIINGGNNFGISSAWPGQKLDVNGSIRATAYSGSGASLTSLASATPTGGYNAVQYSTGSIAGNETKLSFNGTNIGVGTTNGVRLFDVRGDVRTSGNIGIGTSFVTQAALVVLNGNVGIGTWIAQSNLVIKNNTATDLYFRNNAAYTNELGIESSSGNFATYAKAGDFIVRNNSSRLLLNTASSVVVFGDSTSEQMRFSSSVGNLGIGTIDPASPLVVVGNGIGVGTGRNSNVVKTTALSGGLNVEGNVGIGTFDPRAVLQVGSTSPVVIDASGNVGVGSLSPQYAVDVFGSDPKIRMVSSSPSMNLYANPSGSQWRFQNVGTGGATRSYFRWQYIGRDIDVEQASSNVGIGTYYPGSKLTVVGQIGIGTGINSSYLSTAASAGGMIVEGNMGVGTMNAQAQLVVIGNIGIGTWTASNDRFVVRSGNVGIATVSPQAALEIVGIGTTSSTSTLIIRDSVKRMFFNIVDNGNIGIGTSTTPFSLVQWHGIASNQTMFFRGVGQAYLGILGGTGFFFVGQSSVYNVNFGTNNTRQMTITGAGKVGIGTLTPQGNLSVTGFINTSGTSPTLSSCGTGPSIVGSDMAFRFTGGTGATACTATFATARSNAPVCVVIPEYATSTKSYTVSTTAVTYTDAALGTNKVDVICIGLE